MFKNYIGKIGFIRLSVYFSVSCVFVSCSAPKKLLEPMPPVVEVKPVFNPNIHFDESALRLYNMAEAFPKSIRARMINASKDTVQIRFVKFPKGNLGFTRATEDVLQLQKGSLIEAGLMNKVLLALACAKKMQQYRQNGITYNSTMITEAAGENLPGAYNDAYAIKGKPSIGQYLSRMLMQNDIEAYNRIFELVTTSYLNDFAKANGWSGSLNSGRLGRQHSRVEHATMNLINFYDENNRKIYTQKNSVDNIVKIEQGFSNSTSLIDIENIIEALFIDKQKEASLAKEIGEEQLEYVKVLLLNAQVQAQEDAANAATGSASLFFPNKIYNQNLILIPLKTISDKGMSEVLYFFDSRVSKHFILSASLIFKKYSTRAQYKKELEEGKAFFEDLGKMVMGQ